MARTIYRLSCRECRMGLDGVNRIPLGWCDVSRFQSLRHSHRLSTRNGTTVYTLDWFTHLGTCPDCAREAYGEQYVKDVIREQKKARKKARRRAVA